jgi:phospholipid/cholesterol/gamma-HCH transport system substrate-binding protein
MSYKIKHARQIVIAFVSIPVLLLLAALVFIALRQNLLEKKYIYHSTLSNAMGISTQTPVLYRGFEIGRVRDFVLEDDGNIGLKFHVLKRYKQIMVKGSVLVRNTNPVTGKTTLEYIRDPNSKTTLTDGSSIISSDFPEGKQRLKLIAPQLSDPIAVIISNLAELSSALTEDNNADRGSIPRLLVNLADAAEKANTGMNEANLALSELAKLAVNLNRDNNPDSGVLLRTINNLANLSEGLNKRLDELDGIMSSVQQGIDNYKKPDSLLIKLLDPQQELILKPLSNTLNNLSGAAAEMEKILATVNNPELRMLLNNLNDSLAKARKTLEALNNNPLLRKGISPDGQIQNPGTKRLHEVKNAP